jgi:hypothetical protein
LLDENSNGESDARIREEEERFLDRICLDPVEITLLKG